MSSIDSFDRLSTEEVDPAAEFIAREQNLLAELDDEQPQVETTSNLFGSTVKSTSPLEEVDNLLNAPTFDPIVADDVKQPTLLDDDILIGSVQPSHPISSPVMDFDEPPKTSPIPYLENDLVSDFSNELTSDLPNVIKSELTQSNSSLCNGSSSNNSLSYSSNNGRPEPEIVTHWREEQRRRLEEKDTREQEANTKLRNQASSELDDWYDSYRRTLEKRKQDNREAEEKFLQDRDLPGEDWAKVASYCDFANKSSQGRDLSRMRAILLQRKQQDKTNSVAGNEQVVSEL